MAEHGIPKPLLADWPMRSSQKQAHPTTPGKQYIMHLHGSGTSNQDGVDKAKQFLSRFTSMSSTDNTVLAPWHS
jgi:hypothetical protein